MMVTLSHMRIGPPNGQSPLNDIACPMSLSRRPQTLGQRVWKLLDDIEFELLALVVFSLIAWTLSLTVGHAQRTFGMLGG